MLDAGCWMCECESVFCQTVSSVFTSASLVLKYSWIERFLLNTEGTKDYTEDAEKRNGEKRTANIFSLKFPERIKNAVYLPTWLNYLVKPDG